MAIKVRFDPQAFAKLDMVKKSCHRVIFGAHTDLDRELREGNPFDTGFSVNSWWPAVDGSPSDHPNPPGKGQAFGGRGASDPAVLLASVGRLLTLANSAAYIRRLADGYSPQAPAGWIEELANRYQDHVDKHVMNENAKNRRGGA